MPKIRSDSRLRTVKPYFFFAKIYTRKSVALLIVLISSGILELAGLLTLMPLLGRVDPKSGSFQILWVGLLGCFLIMASSTRRLGEKLGIKLRSEIELDQRSLLADKMIQMPWKSISGLDQADLDTALMSEVSQAVNGYLTFLGLIPTFLVVFIMLFSTLFLNYALFMFALIIGFVAFRLSRIESSKQKVYQADLANSYVELNRETSSLVTNLKFLRASGYQRDWLNETKDRFSRTSFLVRESLNSPSRAKWITELSAILLLLTVMAFSILQEDSISKSLVFIAILFRLTPRFQSAQSSWISVVQQAEWMRRWIERSIFFQFEVSGLIKNSNVHPSQLNNFDSENLLELRKVSVHFNKRQISAISDISFKIGLSERVALVGPSGSGKSTLIDVLTGVIPPDDGIILVRGKCLDIDNVETWQREIAWTPQTVPLKTGSILQNLKWLGGGSTDSQIKFALDNAQLKNFVDTLPNGINTELNPKSEISGGQGQRLALARALVRSPSLLILDETTSALDENTETLILSSLSQLKCGIIIATHRLGPLEICERVIALENSRIVFDGPTADYLQQLNPKAFPHD